jgi:hypothetical protein
MGIRLTDNLGVPLTDDVTGQTLGENDPVGPTGSFMYVVFNTCVALVAAVAVMAMPW